MTDADIEKLRDLFAEFVTEHQHLKHGALNVECHFCGWNPFLTVTDSWDFYVPRHVPSLNEMTGKNKQVLRWKRRAVRDSFQKDLALLLFNMKANAYDANSKNGRPTKRRVVMTRRMGKGEKTYDQDNLVGGCKPILDALTRNDIIVDDSKRWLVIHYKQIRDRENPGLHITVEELSDGP